MPLVWCSWMAGFTHQGGVTSHVLNTTVWNVMIQSGQSQFALHVNKFYMAINIAKWNTVLTVSSDGLVIQWNPDITMHRGTGRITFGYRYINESPM